MDGLNLVIYSAIGGDVNSVTASAVAVVIF